MKASSRIAEVLRERGHEAPERETREKALPECTQKEAPQRIVRFAFVETRLESLSRFSFGSEFPSKPFVLGLEFVDPCIEALDRRFKSMFVSRCCLVYRRSRPVNDATRRLPEPTRISAMVTLGSQPLAIRTTADDS